jgi:hypothetical protein
VAVEDLQAGHKEHDEGQHIDPVGQARDPRMAIGDLTPSSSGLGGALAPSGGGRLERINGEGHGWIL